MTSKIYLSSDELRSFAKSELAEVQGYSYEWEGEGVVHLHISKLRHAFGKVGQCLFYKVQNEKNQRSLEGIQYTVLVPSEDNSSLIKVYSNNNGCLTECIPRFIPGKEDLYSRSKGILETGVLSRKHVVIVGLGSFGSQIAVELSKAGIGEFSLFDFDRIELHNISRHTCTLKDLGRLKVDAIEDTILGKNPYATVHKYPIDIVTKTTLFERIVAKSNLVICATDNNHSRFLISSVLYKYKKVGIFGRAITRAAGGDVFRYRPGGPCYACLVGSHLFKGKDEEISSEEAGRRSGAIPAYASSSDVKAMVQVGLSVDIAPICNLMVKLSLIELSIGEKSGLSSLEEDLKYDAYIWANRREYNFAHWHTFYESGGKQTILKWYGLKFPKDDNCPICSENARLDVGNDLPQVRKDDFKGLNINLDQ